MTSASADRRAIHNRRYYERGGKAKITAKREEYRARNITFVRKLKEDNPCTDCKRYWPYYVMHYDHTGTDKVANVSALVREPVSIRKILEEIAKCDLVCANCHAIRTWERRQASVAQFGRAAPF
jgi:hypothetical protein